MVPCRSFVCSPLMKCKNFVARAKKFKLLRQHLDSKTCAIDEEGAQVLLNKEPFKQEKLFKIIVPLR